MPTFLSVRTLLMRTSPRHRKARAGACATALRVSLRVYACCVIQPVYSRTQRYPQMCSAYRRTHAPQSVHVRASVMCVCVFKETKNLKTQGVRTIL